MLQKDIIVSRFSAEENKEVLAQQAALEESSLRTISERPLDPRNTDGRMLIEVTADKLCPSDYLTVSEGLSLEEEEWDEGRDSPIRVLGENDESSASIMESGVFTS